jgi:nicotinamide-nucleotide amidase
MKTSCHKKEAIYLIDKELLDKVSTLLKKQKLTVATAESCTGGLIAHTLTNISGSSDYFERGIVAYGNQTKTELLDIPVDLLIKQGAVSRPVARLMADNIRIKSKADIGLSTSGIAGPTGGKKEKPVGLVYIAISIQDLTRVEKNKFTGNRLEIKEQSCNAALQLLYDSLR